MALKLTIGNCILADSSDGVTMYMRHQKPDLKLKVQSQEIIGGKFARNSARSWGLSFEFVVVVGRQFRNYPEAEVFALQHFSELASGLEGFLSYTTFFGKRFGFENSVLESARVVGEIGVSTEIEYSFRCGKPVPRASNAVSIGNKILSLLGKIVTIKS